MGARRAARVPMLTSLAMLAGAALGCWPGGPEILALSGTDSSSSGSDPSSGPTSSPPTTSTTSITTADTGPGSTTTAADSTGTTLAPTDSSSGGCPPGAEGCPCAAGGSCDLGLECNGETCELPVCRPLDRDPHDDEDTAIELAMIMCASGMDLGVIGTIDGVQTDWYTYFGNDGFGCAEQPAAVVTADEPLQVCVYLECANGGAVEPFACAAGSMPDTSPSDRLGCCGDGAAEFESYDCLGFGSKDVDVYVSISSDVPVCADYGLAYSF